MEPIVIARFPRISSSGRQAVRREALASRGRLLSQALSLKLLAVAVLILMAVAVVPLTVGTQEKPSDASTAVDSAPAWRPDTPALAAEVQAPPAVATVQTPPVADPTSTPEQPEAPSMSVWPNPAHPTSPLNGTDDKPSETDPANMAVRPTDYD